MVKQYTVTYDKTIYIIIQSYTYYIFIILYNSTIQYYS